MERVFTVRAGTDAVWAVLGDLGGLADCVPGLVQAERDGAAITARLRLRVGANQVTYVGRLAPHTADRAAGLVRFEGDGTEARGAGEASVSVRIRLQDSDPGTAVTVIVEAAGAGRIAAFDPILVRDAGGRLLDRFVAALTERLSAAAVSAGDGVGAPQDERLPLAEPQPPAERQPRAEPQSLGESQPARVRRPRPESEPSLATVTSIAGAVAVRSRARRAAASAALLLVGIVALWFTRRRGN